MKKRDKLPEVVAFEQAFDQPGQNGARPGQPSKTNSGRLNPGQTPAGSTFGVSSGLWNPRQPPAPLTSRTSGRLPTPSQRLRQSPSSSIWAPPGQPNGRGSGAGRGQDWEMDDEEEEMPPPRRNPSSRSASPRAAGERLSGLLVAAVLAVLALFAAYSMQSHSQRNLNPGFVSGSMVSGICYGGGWPLTYAHVDVQQPVPLSDVEPSPASHYIQPVPFFIDIVLLSVPIWLLLEAVWCFWTMILERIGTRRPLRRFFAIGFTLLPAALWMLAALAAGTFAGFLSASNTAWPVYLWPALAPAVPGFGLTALVSVVLSIPATAWPQDFGVFLLLVAIPLALLTACLYALFGLIGRRLRNLARGGQR